MKLDKKSCRIIRSLSLEPFCARSRARVKKIGPCQNHIFGRFSKIVGNCKVLASRIGSFGIVRGRCTTVKLCGGTPLLLGPSLAEVTRRAETIENEKRFRHQRPAKQPVSPESVTVVRRARTLPNDPVHGAKTLKSPTIFENRAKM